MKVGSCGSWTRLHLIHPMASILNLSLCLSVTSTIFRCTYITDINNCVTRGNFLSFLFLFDKGPKLRNTARVGWINKQRGDKLVSGPNMECALSRVWCRPSDIYCNIRFTEKWELTWKGVLSYLLMNPWYSPFRRTSGLNFKLCVPLLLFSFS